MELGTVKFFCERGYGYIRRDNGQPDIFVHVKHIAGRLDLESGQRVQFEIGENERGLLAVNVEPVSE